MAEASAQEPAPSAEASAQASAEPPTQGPSSTDVPGPAAAAPEAEPGEGTREAETAVLTTGTRLRIVEAPLADGWIEVTAVGQGPQGLRLPSRSADASPLAIDLQLAPAPAVICAGAQGRAAVCRVEALSPPEVETEIDLELEVGRAVVGRYLVGPEPVAGARVSVVPTILPEDRFAGFVQPLALVDGALTRAAVTDVDGRFRLPELAAGEYLLETELPSGRLDRDLRFIVAAPDPELEPLVDGAPLPLDLGDRIVSAGLDVVVQVVDPDGAPIVGALVVAQQGEQVRDLEAWRATSGADGTVSLSGFFGEREVHLSCRASGRRLWRRSFQPPPVEVECVLDSLGEVAGRVVGVGGEPLDDAVVELQPLEANPTQDAEVAAVGALPTTDDREGDTALATRRLRVADDGTFAFPGLGAGRWGLVVSAPGHATVRDVVDVGDDGLDLGDLVLLLGRSVAVRVVDVETGEPIAGALLAGLEPLGTAEALTDADGEADLVLDDAEPVPVEVVADGYAARRVEIAPRDDDVVGPRAVPAGGPPEGPQIIELQRGGRLRIVVQRDNGEACVDCRVRIAPARELRTGPDGEVLSERLEPGIYRVIRDGRRRVGSEIVTSPEAEVREVRVRTDETSLVRFGGGAVLRVRFEPEPPERWWMVAQGGFGQRRAEPDADGVVEFRRRGRERLDLVLAFFDAPSGAVQWVRQATVRAGADVSELTLEPAAARVRGVVEWRREPAAALRVRLRTVGEGAWVAEARTRPDGSFDLRYLPAGVYQLVIGQSAVQNLSLQARQQLDLRTTGVLDPAEPGG